mgnify:CR=1 FL=1
MKDMLSLSELFNKKLFRIPDYQRGYAWEKQQVEDLVNQWIKDSIPVTHYEVSKEEAVKLGAEAQFIERYGDRVTVYQIGDVSLEICGGPHVSNTSELGHFKIKKEESSSAGVRRIKAVLTSE